MVKKTYGSNFKQGLESLRSTIMMHKQSSLPLIKVNKNCSTDNINMMIRGMLSMISQVMKRDVTDDTSSRMDREIGLFLSYLNIVSTHQNRESYHMTIYGNKNVTI